MFSQTEWVAFAACLTLLTTVGELVRRRKIQTRYSLLWLTSGVTLLTLVYHRPWLESLAQIMGIHYPPTALFLVFNAFLVSIMVHFSMVVSKLVKQNVRSAQELALLGKEIEALRNQNKRSLARKKAA